MSKTGTFRGKLGASPLHFDRNAHLYIHCLRQRMSCALRGLLRTASAMGQAPYPKRTLLPREPKKRRILWISFIARSKSFRGTRDVPLSPHPPTSALRDWKTRGTAPPMTIHGSGTSSTPKSCCPPMRLRNTRIEASCGTAWNGTRKSAMPSLPARWSWHYRRSLPTTRTSL